MALPKDFQNARYGGHYIAAHNFHFSQIKGQRPDKTQRQILQYGKVIKALIGKHSNQILYNGFSIN